VRGASTLTPENPEGFALPFNPVGIFQLSQQVVGLTRRQKTLDETHS
jgi:hypothetical protein